MSVIVHGVPARSLETDGAARYGRDAARHGAFFETVTARALEDVLAAEPGTFHLFHDLGGFRNVSGHGYDPISPGINIDHLVLTRSGYVLVNAKGTGPGMLAVIPGDRGIIVKPDGRELPQRWLDSRIDYAGMGVVIRLTGLLGLTLFVVSHHTTTHESICHARALHEGRACLLNTAQVREGQMVAEMPEILDGSPAEPEHVAALRRYLSVPDVPARAGVVSPPIGDRPAVLEASPARPRYPWDAAPR